MISFQEAYSKVLAQKKDFGTEQVDLLQALDRLLAENIFADRDFPPFHRATKDGIAIAFEAFANKEQTFDIEGIAAAGSPQLVLKDKSNCLEVMTGAILPEGADTIIMYEDVQIEKGSAKINSIPEKGQNIHSRGADANKDSLLLKSGTIIREAEIGILATVGKSEVRVKKMPEVALISTGNELVEINEFPEAYQIRRSNIYTLKTALSRLKINAQDFHINDRKEMILQKIKTLLNEYDILILSGGVSKGKYDYLPEVFEALGVKKIFHKVKQRPGKPFWFGQHEATNTTIFSFPGNPNSTYLCFQVYFVNWLNTCLGIGANKIKKGILQQAVKPMNTFTLLKQMHLCIADGKALLKPIDSNGSGDLLSLTKSNAVAIIPPDKEIYEAGELVEFISFARLPNT